MHILHKSSLKSSITCIYYATATGYRPKSSFVQSRTSRPGMPTVGSPSCPCLKDLFHCHLHSWYMPLPRSMTTFALPSLVIFAFSENSNRKQPCSSSVLSLRFFFKNLQSSNLLARHLCNFTHDLWEVHLPCIIREFSFGLLVQAENILFAHTLYPLSFGSGCQTWRLTH